METEGAIWREPPQERYARQLAARILSINDEFESLRRECRSEGDRYALGDRWREAIYVACRDAMAVSDKLLEQMLNMATADALRAPPPPFILPLPK